METETILHTALFSGILGFLVFCASYALHVWRSRNATNRQKTAQIPGGRLLRWSLLSIGLGCALLLVSIIWQEVKPREGILSGDGLYTVRAESNLKVEYVTDARKAAKGEVLARFHSPERRAEQAELELKKQILQTQRKVIELQPLTPDNELVRHYEKCVADQRQLLASMTYLIPEHAVVVREKLRDQLDKTERINSLTTRIENARRELQQAQARRTLAEKYQTSMKNLSGTGATAEIEVHKRDTDSVVQEVEVSRLQVSIENMEIERKHLQDGLPTFAACTSRQAEDIDRQLVRVREQLSDSEQELKTSQEQLGRDRNRAELLKVEMLSQLDLEIRQCQAKIDGIQDVLTIRAPFNGIVAYADPAPGMALPMAPVIILTPEQGFRFRLRMAEAEIASLSRTESVTLGLVVPVLHRRFTGRLIKWYQLEHEPGYVLAELACDPPAETIRDLAAHDWGMNDWVMMPTIKVRLLWQPPVYVMPMFYPAIFMIGTGLIGIGGAWLQRSQTKSLPIPRLTNLPSSAEPVPSARSDCPAELIMPVPAVDLALDAATIESGALGRGLEMLGQRFRESIKRQHVEPALLQALEWALDRHHTRAIQHLAAGLDHDSELPSCLEKWQQEERARAGGSDSGHECASDRVFRIVRAVAPELLNGLQTPAAVKRSSTTQPSAFTAVPATSSHKIQTIGNTFH